MELMKADWCIRFSDYIALKYNLFLMSKKY